MGRLVDIRARIALIRKQVNATLQTIQPLLLRNRAGAAGAVGGRAKSVFGGDYPYGAIIDSNDQRTFEMPRQGVETDKIVHSVKADLQSVAAAVGFADFVISADSGNAFAGALVKEGPMDKAVGCTQQDLIDDDIDVFERALVCAAEAGRLPDDVLEQVAVKVEPPKIIARNTIQEAQAAEIYNRIGAESTETVSEKAGFDYDVEQARLKANPTLTMQAADLAAEQAKANIKAAGMGGMNDNKRSHQSPALGKTTARAVPAGSEPGPGAVNQRAEESLHEDALLETCDESHIIDNIPDIRQDTHWTCGCCATQVVAKHFGVGPDKIEDYIKALDATETHSTNPQNIVAYLMSLGLKVHARSHMTIGQLATAIKHGSPVIVCLQDYGSVRPAAAAFNFGHYLCVQGVIGRSPNRYVIAQDSSGENAGYVPGGDVPKDQADNTSDIADLGKIMVPEKRWMEVWHDQDANGVKYIRYGIIVSAAPKTKEEAEND